MLQFLRCKEEYPDAILFFRLGDFYEMFFDDAVLVSELLDLTLTSRSKTSDGQKIPMAGVPHHAAASYISRLIERGKKVAICEQMADPSTVKGVVPREVVRVVTPGLCVEPDALDARLHNFLAVVVAGPDAEGIGLASLELSTGELRACRVADGALLLAELARLDAREVLLAESLQELAGPLERALPNALVSALEMQDGEAADRVLAEVLGASEAARAAGELPALGVRAAAEALRYAIRTQPGRPLGVRRVGLYDPSSQLELDEAAVRNLEIVRTLAGDRKGALLYFVDETRSPMGARLLRRRLLSPTVELADIRRRHDLVEELLLDAPLRQALRQSLSSVGDMERLTTRADLGVATPKDLGALRDGLRAVGEVADEIAARRPQVDDVLGALAPQDRCADVLDMLDTALVDEPPASAAQAGIFRSGIDTALDEARRLSTTSKDVILQVERRERQATGIGSLKVRYTRVFGHYMEVTKSNLSSVPAHYRRKQTVANAERFVTDELEELGACILNADERARRLEGELFADLRARVAREATRLRRVASRISALDVHASFAEVAHRWDYTRPEMDDGLVLEFRELRHPVVERLAPAGEFVPNDVRLDAESERLMVLTGPNMSGKSTAMRQVALAVVLAQAGGFVPAAKARIGVVDRVFTRVGASDNLAGGQSTFMVEMRETAAILTGASRRSLVVLDEIGRGTSTYDGLAIAWAVAEHLHDAIRCRAMFATHYHELCALHETCPGAANYNVAAREYDGEVVFLHKLVRGGANRSYGVAVARLAGVPEIVLARARAILADLEEGGAPPSGHRGALQALVGEGAAQLSFFGAQAPVRAIPSKLEETLRHLDVERIRPVDALLALARLKDLLEGEEGGGLDGA